MRFVEDHARLKNGKQAALAAGYGEGCAAAMASRLLRKPEIQAALIEAGIPLAFSTYGAEQATRIGSFLNPRQERFIEHYLILGKGAEAARRAGYSARSAYATADKLLHNPLVVAAIDEANAARAQRMKIDADRVLAELARLGFADLGRIAEWGPDGMRIKPGQELAPEDRAAVAEVVVETGGGKTKLKVKLFNKQRALDSLAKHLGLYAKNARPSPEATLIDGRDPRDVLRERLQRLIAAEDDEKT